MIEQYLEQDCLTFDTYEAAAQVQRILIENGYVVAISKEEHLWCLNWVWTETPANRNDIIFRSRSMYEDEYDQFLRRHDEIDWSKENM